MKNSLEQRTSALLAAPAKTNHLANRVYRSLLVTMALSILAFTIGMLIDSIVTANVLGTAALAAAGVVSPVYLVPMTIVGVLQIGSVALIMRYLGMEKIPKAVDLFTVISVLCVIIGIVLTCIFWFFADTITVFLGAKGEVVAMVSDYMKGLSLGMIPILIGQYLLFMTRIDGHSKLCLVCVLVIAAVNITLDLYFSIVLGWGMFGMALATSISNGVGAIICVVPFLAKKGIFHFRFYRSQRQKGVLKETLKTGLPTAVVRFSQLAFLIVINNILLVEGMTVFNVQNSVSSLNATLYAAVGQAVAVMISLYYGEKDKRSIKDVIKVSLKSSVVLGACSAGIFIIFAPAVAGIFAITDPPMVALCIKAIVLFVIGLPVQIAMYAITSFYQSVEKPLISSILTAMFLLIMPLGCVFVFRPFMGDTIIWFALSAGAILTLLVLPLFTWVVSKKFPKSMDDYMMLTITSLPTFLCSMQTNQNEVAKISKQIGVFCLNAGVDQQSSANTVFAMEQMAKNVVVHGFKNSNTHFADIRIVVHPEKVLMRIRDNAPPFNPLSSLAAQSEAATASGGIQRVNAIAQQMDYKNTIGMNCLLVTISRNSVVT